MDAPSAPTGVTASDGSFSGKVQMTWTPATFATSYDVYRSDMPAWTGAAPKRIASSVTGTSYSDTTAANRNRYYYWVKSRNSSGVSGYSKFDTGYWGTPGSMPSRPTGVSATDGTVSGKVNITWDATANSLVYEIWRADIPIFLGGRIKKIGISATTSYSDATAVNGNRYYYWVKARNSWGVSKYSLFDTGYTGASSSPPNAPSGVSATDSKDSVTDKITITWNPSSGAILYEVWRSSKRISYGGQPERIRLLEGTSFDDTTVTCDITYYYWVKAIDSWGSSTYSIYDTGHCNSASGDFDGDGYAENDGDCNDNNENVYPGAIEISDDGIDQDCDGNDLILYNTLSINCSNYEGNSDFKPYYQSQEGPHHIVLINSEGKPHTWNDSLPSKWQPESLSSIELLICIDEESVTKETCEYRITGYSTTGKIYRKQYKLNYTLFEAYTGNIIKSGFIYGSLPKACPFNASFRCSGYGCSSINKYGSHVELSDLIDRVTDYVE